MTPLELVEAQLTAYNSGDLDAFCKNFADDIEVYDGLGPDAKLMIQGMDEYRSRYATRLKRHPDTDPAEILHAHIEKRIVLGDVVIDHEQVTGIGDKPLQVIAIYKIEKDTIAKVFFVNRTLG